MNSFKSLWKSLILIISSTYLFAGPEIVRFTTIELSDQWGGGLYWIGGDGTIFGGGYYYSAGFRWTFENGEENIGGMYIRDMDNNGVVVGETMFPMLLDGVLTDVEAAAYYDDVTEEWEMIGPILGTAATHSSMYQGAWAIAADTMVVAGMYWHDNATTTAFVWSSEDSLGQLLMDYGDDLNSRPNDISADGRVIVGWASIWDGSYYSDRTAQVWTYNDATGNYDLLFIGDLVNDPYHDGEAHAVSPDGRIVTGWSGGAMFIWTATDGMQNAGYAPGHDPAVAGVVPMAINDHGTSVGFAQAHMVEWSREAVIYTPESGIVFLEDSLITLGFEDQLEDWMLLQANDISDDGLIIVGTCVGTLGILQPFILEFLPPDTPQNLQLSYQSDGTNESIELAWDAIANNEYGYALERRATENGVTSDWQLIANPDSSVNSYIDGTIYSGGIDWEYRLRAENPVGVSDWATAQIYLSTENELVMPVSFGITTIFPNPFNPTTRIRFELPEAMPVEMALYSVIGTQVAVIYEGQLVAGAHEHTLDLSGYSTGTYFVKLQGAGFEDVQKITLVK